MLTSNFGLFTNVTDSVGASDAPGQRAALCREVLISILIMINLVLASNSRFRDGACADQHGSGGRVTVEFRVFLGYVQME